MNEEVRPLAGRCTCGLVRYVLKSEPLFVHCCHCRWCQRETGTAFALNALIETDRVLVEGDVPEIVATPSNSGKGQKIARCPRCRVAVWSHYAGAGDLFAFIRVGTLDDPDRVPPDIHIFTASKQPWVILPEETPAVTGYLTARATGPRRVWRAATRCGAACNPDRRIRQELRRIRHSETRPPPLAYCQTNNDGGTRRRRHLAGHEGRAMSGDARRLAGLR